MSISQNNHLGRNSVVDYPHKKKAWMDAKVFNSHSSGGYNYQKLQNLYAAEE